jgi:NADH:ubiquinone oxidoreductase subunit F (NADH-binding)
MANNRIRYWLIKRLYLHRAEYPLAIDRLKIAINQARAYGLLGDNIMEQIFVLTLN